jgi:uncharacterized protein YuzE
MLKQSIKLNKGKSSFYYDRDHDILSIFLHKNIQPNNVEEPFDDIFYHVNDDSHIITSIEIWYFSKRNIASLKKKLSIEFDYSLVTA